MIGRDEVVAEEEEAVVPDLRIRPMAEDKNVHPRGATNLAPQVVAAVAQVVGQILVSAEMIDVSASLVPAEHLKVVKAEMDPTEEEGHHCVSPTLGDDKEEVRAADLSERGTEQLNERPRPRPPRNVERLFCQSKLMDML